jgi:hypothetical protein
MRRVEFAAAVASLRSCGPGQIVVELEGSAGSRQGVLLRAPEPVLRRGAAAARRSSSAASGGGEAEREAMAALTEARKKGLGNLLTLNTPI